jgi:hypothetical protein
MSSSWELRYLLCKDLSIPGFSKYNVFYSAPQFGQSERLFILLATRDELHTFVEEPKGQLMFGGLWSRLTFCA